MRRQDRRVTDIEEIKGILNSTRIIHLGMMDGDYPYVVPLHFGFEFIDEVLYIYVHGHYEGKKFDLIKANPHVFIEIDGSDEALVSGGDIPLPVKASEADFYRNHVVPLKDIDPSRTDLIGVKTIR